mmetsp:Transcript_41099/g.86349  ORF Transcript_41099/g.86349 Transcript_41099/m.86349 type:complete len:111 (+) Transcript_41099:1220-1552(+)
MIGGESIGAEAGSAGEADDASDLMTEGAGGDGEIATAYEYEAYPGYHDDFSPGDVEHDAAVVYSRGRWRAGLELIFWCVLCMEGSSERAEVGSGEIAGRRRRRERRGDVS